MLRWLLIAVLVAGAATVLWDFKEHLESLVTFVRDGGLLGGVVFFLVVAVSGVVASPIWLPGIVGGYVYGLAGGFVFGFIALIAHLSMGFVLARTLLRAVVLARMERWSAWPRVEAALEHEGTRIVLLLRATPLVPQNVLSFALGATSLPYSRFLVGSLGLLPMFAFHVYLGVSASRIEELTQNSNSRAFLVVGVLVSALGLWLVVRTATRVLKKALNEESGVSEP